MQEWARHHHRKLRTITLVSTAVRPDRQLESHLSIDDTNRIIKSTAITVIVARSKNTADQSSSSSITSVIVTKMSIVALAANRRALRISINSRWTQESPFIGGEGGGEEGQSDFPFNGRARRAARAAVAFVSRRPAGPATANRCIAGAHPERLRECRGELKSFTST